MRYYYCSDNTNVLGPHDLRVIRALVDSGELPPTTQICAEGGEDWLPVGPIAPPSPPKPTVPANAQEWGRRVGKELERLAPSLASPSVFLHPNIPLAKLGGATMSYAGALTQIDDLAFLLLDSTVFGLGGTGMILGMQTLFWKNPFGSFGSPHSLPLNKVRRAIFAGGFINKKILINDKLPIEFAGVSDETAQAVATLITFFAKPEILSLLQPQIWN